MARKIVAFLGSPRKGGNTDVLASEILSAAAKEGAQTEKVYLSDLTIKPCTACEACRKQAPPKCVQTDDDFGATAEKMRVADALVFATPVYWLGPTAQFKLFMDRWLGFLNEDWSSPLKGKSAAVVVCCGDANTESMTDSLLHVFRVSLKFLEIDLVDCITVSAHAKGEVAQNKAAMTQATEAGRKLAAP